MSTKIYDSRETLEAGLKAEQDTIIEYTRYLNLAKENGNDAEVKLWEHIIADEEEHAKEFENALEGNFKLLDDKTIIKPKSPRRIKEESERDETFMDDLNDVLVDNGLDYKKYIISNEDNHFYIDFGSNKEDAEKAFEILTDNFYKCNLVQDDDFDWSYVHVLRR